MSVAISALSFIINGVVGRRIRQGQILLTVKDHSAHFVLLSDYIADQRELTAWRTHLVEDVVKPMSEMMKSVHALSISSSVQAEALKYISAEISETKDELREVRDELRRRNQAN